MTKKISILLTLLLLASYNLFSQVKIGSNPGTINANSLLELESTTKGFLPPRVTLTDVSSYAPLSATIVAGMLVYNSGSTLSEGYYYWSGSAWKKIESGESTPVTKTANASLTKNETLVLVNPSGTSATITLPNISAVDNGLTVTVKNIGGADDIVIVQDYGDDPIDGDNAVTLTRWRSQTFIATNSDWIIKTKVNSDDHLLEVNANSSWTTIPEVISYLEAHMDGPTVVRLGDSAYTLSATQVIDLSYPVTFQGLSYGTTSIVPHATNLLGKTMFRCLSDCYFKMLNFSYNGVASYGDGALEDAIHFLGSGTYNEIKDCTFDGFYNTIIDSSNAELWVFETDISDANRNGILLHSPDAGAILKVAETDFISCKNGINLSKGSGATIQLASGGYYNTNSGSDTAIFYQPTTFTSFTSISITGNSWNNQGKYIEGFDFTRSDGRDANAILESNAGVGDKRPNCYLNLLNSATTTALTTATTTWYKANWDYTKLTSSTCKWTILNTSGGTVATVNRITFQPNNRRDCYMTISGNISLSSATATVNIGVVKNPSTTSSTSITRYGETTLRPGVASQPYQFSTTIYLTDVAPTDYFELWFNSNTASVTLTVQDLQWIVNTQ